MPFVGHGCNGVSVVFFLLKALQEPSVRSRDASDANLPPELELEDISMALTDKGRSVGAEEEEEEQVRTVRRERRVGREERQELRP